MQQQQRDRVQNLAQESQRQVCPNCSGTEIEFDERSGSSVCIVCGVVVEENAIVSSIEFSEAGGSSQVIGQFVSASMSKPYTSSGRRGGRYGFSRDSRETTLANGRRRIQDVASRLRLGAHFVDAAHRYFQIAVEKNFVQGRKTTHVVAACLYIACRQQKSQHMLIDFSDALQVNVYTLGTCFLKFRRLLGLKLEVIDPALYVYRFAAHLELGEKSNAVALTALRVVGRMKRDWIVTGRRPAGVCAAALLIATRAHGFGKTPNDVAKILRVCGVTVSARIKEFEQTPSAQLTFEQFNTMDLETEADPPSFTRNRTEEIKAIEDGSAGQQLITTGGAVVRTQERRDDRQLLYDSLAEDLRSQRAPADSASSSSTSFAPGAANSLFDDGINLPSKGGVRAVENRLAVARNHAIQPFNPLQAGTRATAVSGGEQKVAAYTEIEQKIDLEKWMREIPANLMGPEVDALLRPEAEVKEKEKIFETLNKDYLEKVKAKEQSRLDAERLESEKAREAAAQTASERRFREVIDGVATAADDEPSGAAKEGVGPGGKRGSYNTKKRKMDAKVAAAAAAGVPVEEETVRDALLNAMVARKVSRKINYDAMSKLFGNDGGFRNPDGDEDDNGDDDARPGNSSPPDASDSESSGGESPYSGNFSFV